MFSECSLKDFYDFTQWRGLGNSMWYDNCEEILKNILKLLKQKYPDTDFRIKFLKVLIIKSETHEIEVEQEEALEHYCITKVILTNTHWKILLCFVKMH